MRVYGRQQAMTCIPVGGKLMVVKSSTWNVQNFADNSGSALLVNYRV
jgi:hypothetical protein